MIFSVKLIWLLTKLLLPAEKIHSNNSHICLTIGNWILVEKFLLSFSDIVLFKSCKKQDAIYKLNKWFLKNCSLLKKIQIASKSSLYKIKRKAYRISSLNPSTPIFMADPALKSPGFRWAFQLHYLEWPMSAYWHLLLYKH